MKEEYITENERIELEKELKQMDKDIEYNKGWITEYKHRIACLILTQAKVMNVLKTGKKI